MNKYILEEIVECIMESADELHASKNKGLFEQGQLLAYVESLTIIQDAMSGYDLSEIGLDFDPDEKYFGR